MSKEKTEIVAATEEQAHQNPVLAMSVNKDSE